MRARGDGVTWKRLISSTSSSRAQMKNYSLLFSKVSTWLRSPQSLLFIHIFCHRTTPYHFEQSDGWMAQNFFSGGTMPCHDLFLHFQQDVVLERLWWVNGRHYAQTCEDWLRKQDEGNKGGKAVRALREDAVKKGSEAVEGEKTFYRFRVFYLACAEFFGEWARSGGWGKAVAHTSCLLADSYEQGRRVGRRSLPLPQAGLSDDDDGDNAQSHAAAYLSPLLTRIDVNEKGDITT